MARVRDWFMEHPPSRWVTCLEAVVKVLNTLMVLLGSAVLIWSIVTVIQIQHEPSSRPPTPPPAPVPTPTPTPPPHPAPQPRPPKPHPPPRPPLASAAAAFLQAAVPPLLADASPRTPNLAKLLNVPWFIYVFGALGAATALIAIMALLATRLRSLGCVSSHIFFMCLLLTGQACAAVAFFIDKGWEHRLPDIDEKLKAFLAERLQVCKWVGVGLFLLQLLTMLMSCGLQSAYVRADEAAEDADEEAAWRRRPLLQQQARRQQQQQQAGRGTPSPAAGASAAAAGGADDDGWAERMQQQYGLDTSQFGHQPGSRGGGGPDGQQPGGSSSSKGCVIA